MHWILKVDGKEVARWPYLSEPPDAAKRYCPSMGKDHNSPSRMEWFCGGSCKLERSVIPERLNFAGTHAIGGHGGHGGGLD